MFRLVVHIVVARAFDFEEVLRLRRRKVEQTLPCLVLAGRPSAPADDHLLEADRCEPVSAIVFPCFRPVYRELCNLDYSGTLNGTKLLCCQKVLASNSLVTGTGKVFTGAGNFARLSENAGRPVLLIGGSSRVIDHAHRNWAR